MFAEDVLLGLLEDLRPSLPQADGQGIVMSAHIVRYASRISQVQGTFMSRELIRFLDSFGADLDYDIVRPPPADKHSDTANQDRVMLEVGE